MKATSLSLRTQFLFIGLLVALPFFAISTFTVLQIRRFQEERFLSDTRDAVETGISMLKERIDDSRKILELLSSQLSSITDQHAALEDIVRTIPEFEDIRLLSTNGDVRDAASLSGRGSVDSDPAFIPTGSDVERFSVGEPQYDVVSGRWELPLTYPYFDGNDHVVGLLYAVLDLDRFSTDWNRLLSRFPSGSALFVMGNAYVRESAPGDTSARAWNQTNVPFSRASLSEDSGFIESHGLRWYFKRLELSGPASGSAIAIGVPLSKRYGVTGPFLWILLTVIVGIGAMIMISGWLLIDRRALRPLHRAFQTLHDLERGDLRARTSESGIGGEVGTFMRALNHTAGILEERALTQERLLRELEESSARYRLLVETSVDAIVLVDDSLRVIAANSTAQKLFGLNREEDARRPVKDFVCEINRDMITRRLSFLFNSLKRIHGFEVAVLDASGDCVPAEVTVSEPVSQADGSRVVVVVIRDVRERKRAQQEQDSLRAQLTRAQRAESMGTLAAGIAHDFNNILTVIQGYVGLAKLETQDQSPVSEHITEIGHATRRAAELTRQLLLFGRGQMLSLSAIDLGSAIEDLSRMLHRVIGEDVHLLIEQDEELWPVKGDRTQLEQVVMNLAVNARDAMPAGGELKIGTRNVRTEPDGRRLPQNAKAGEYVCLSVSDTGFGIPQELKDRIFEPFFTTKQVGHGTGLGLSVTFGIVREHGGFIELDSEPDRGTTFRIYLPAARTEVSAANSLQGGRTETGDGETILVVDDDLAIVEITQNVLMNNGYRVKTAQCAADAWKVFGSSRSRIDLVLSDIVLPDGSGLDLLKELRAARPHTAVIATSGYDARRTSEVEKIRAEGLPFLPKPYAVQDLLSHVHTSLSRRHASAVDA